MDGIENRIRHIYNCGYQRGYEDWKKAVNEQAEKITYTDIDEAYQRGLEDAWECARKLMLSREHGGLSSEVITEIFNFNNFLEGSYDVLKNYPVQQVMQKIKDYEERQTEEIKVGDEVEVGSCIGIVTRHKPNTDTCYVLYRDGSCGEIDVEDCKKTGNHSVKLDQWLEQMRKESE
jgi:hypothetical protein